MSIEQLIKKKEECMISGSFGGKGVFLLFAGCPFFPFFCSFYNLKNSNSFSTKQFLPK
jgi:hypothetical protein